jgi:hypothetical protein
MEGSESVQIITDPDPIHEPKNLQIRIWKISKKCSTLTRLWMGMLQYEAYERLKEQEEDRDKKVEKVVKKKRYYTDSPKAKNRRK